MVLESSAFIVLTQEPVRGVVDPAGLRVGMGAALPIPPEVAPAMSEALTHLLFVLFVI